MPWVSVGFPRYCNLDFEVVQHDATYCIRDGQAMPRIVKVCQEDSRSVKIIERFSHRMPLHDMTVPRHAFEEGISQTWTSCSCIWHKNMQDAGPCDQNRLFWALENGIIVSCLRYLVRRCAFSSACDLAFWYVLIISDMFWFYRWRGLAGG